MFCWQCGKEIYPGAFFCTNCGTKAVQPQEAGQQEPPVRMMTPAPESTVRPLELQEPVGPAPESTVRPVELQEPVGPAPESTVRPVELQEPVAPAPESTVRPLELQEPVAPAPESAVRPLEPQEPVAPAPESAVRPMELQEPIVQIPPAVIVPSAAMVQPGEAQAPMPAGSGMQGPGMQRYVSVMPAEQKPAPKPLKKGVFVAVVIVAALVFLAGVAGAFYFAENGGDSDGGMTQGRREELRDDSVSHREDIGEYSQLDDSDNSDEKKEEEIGNNSEVQREDPGEANPADPGEDSIEENQSFPWDNPMEGKRIPAFSGRDIYPGIDGYAEGKPGDSMHTYWFDYTVTSAYICKEYGGYLPKAGYEVLVVEMAVRNTFDEQIPMFDDDFQAQWNDMSDNAYAWPIEDAELLGEDVLPAYYVLEEGQVAIGLLLFEVPAGYTDFSLAYWEIFEDNTYGDLFFLDFTVDRDPIENTI